MILFRADGNPQIGTGHVMRCLSLADAFQERGIHSVFVTAESCMRQLIQGRGYECVVLGSAYDHLEDELAAFLPLLEARRPGCVVLDSYFVTPCYMRAVKERVPLAYIDDLNAFDYPADVVINYDLYGEKMDYPPNKTYLLGPRYTPLRKQFRGLAPREVRETVEQVLISTGGTDPCHIALGCITYLREHPPVSDMTYHLVLGAMNPDVKRIRELAVKMSCVALHQHVTDMRALMLRCDAAVSAAGTTLYELCASGLPTVTYILADNQIEGARAFEEAGLMPCAGDIRGEPVFADRIFMELGRLTADWRGRAEISRRMQNLVDGRGAPRLAETLVGLLGGEGIGL